MSKRRGGRGRAGLYTPREALLPWHANVSRDAATSLFWLAFGRTPADGAPANEGGCSLLDVGPGSKVTISHLLTVLDCGLHFAMMTRRPLP